MGFCLPITQFTEKQCKTIQTRFYQALLPKLGFNRHIPLQVRYGPPKYNGKGLVEFLIQQYIQHITHLVKHLRANGEIGQLLQMEIDIYQMTIGSETHFFELNPSQYSYGEKTFIHFIWELNHKYGINILIASNWQEKIVRENDTFIMDVVVKKITRPNILKRINDVRLFLKVS